MPFKVIYKTTYTVENPPTIEQFLLTVDPVEFAGYPDVANKTPLEIYLDTAANVDFKVQGPRAGFISETISKAHNTVTHIWETEADYMAANPPFVEDEKPMDPAGPQPTEEELAEMARPATAYGMCHDLYHRAYGVNVSITTEQI